MTEDMALRVSELDIGDAAYRELLLLADPDEERVAHYTTSGTCFQANLEHTRIGGAVWHPGSTRTVELLNLTVHPTWQGRGYGKQFLNALLTEARARGFHGMTVGTGNSSLGPLALYQKAGFRIEGVVKDYFLRHYPDPIVEHGIRCCDMIRLHFDLTE